MKPRKTCCRICGAKTGPKHPEYPFCSERCRQLDLGRWASESYRVAVPPEDDSEIPEQPGGESEAHGAD